LPFRAFLLSQLMERAQSSPPAFGCWAFSAYILNRLQTKTFFLLLPQEPLLTNSDFPLFFDSDIISEDSFLHVCSCCFMPPAMTGYLEGSNRAIIPASPFTSWVSSKRSDATYKFE
jgi:hypothetical protein